MGWSNYDCIWLAKFLPLLSIEIQRYNSQVAIIPVCVSSEEHIMPCLYHFHGCLRLLVLAGMHPVYLVGSLL